MDPKKFTPISPQSLRSLEVNELNLGFEHFLGDAEVTEEKKTDWLIVFDFKESDQIMTISRTL